MEISHLAPPLTFGEAQQNSCGLEAHTALIRFQHDTYVHLEMFSTRGLICCHVEYSVEKESAHVVRFVARLNTHECLVWKKWSEKVTSTSTRIVL